MQYISHSARTVTALDDYMLFVEYCEGVSRLYDVKPLFNKIPIFNQLKENNLFNQVHLAVGGDGIIWNDEIDLSAEEPYQNGTPIPSRFDGIMALGDAAEVWNMDDSTSAQAEKTNGAFRSTPHT